MYKVYRVYLVDGKLEEYFWGEWADADTANEVALQLREEEPALFSTVVHYEP